VIHPKPVEDVDWVSATYQTILGKIEVSWFIVENSFSLELNIPMNMSALVYLPTDAPRYVKESGISIYEISGMKFLGVEDGKSVFDVPAGKYEFTTPYN
jgi:alpha-L-rhamnosidase